MKHLGKALAFAAVVMAGPAAAASIYGVWDRGNHKDKMEFYDCGGKLCAHGIYPSPDTGGEPQLIIRHAAKTSENVWKGDIYDPFTKHLFSATVTLKGDELTLAGCALAVLCKTETWTRDTSFAPAGGNVWKGNSKPPKANGGGKPAKPGAKKPADEAPVEEKPQEE